MLLILHKSFLSQIQARFQLEVLVPYIVERASLCVWQTNKHNSPLWLLEYEDPCSYSEIRRRRQYCWDNQLTEPIHPMSTQVQQHAKHIFLPWTCSPVNPTIMTTNTLSLQYYTHFNLFKSSVYNSQNFYKWLPNSRGLSSYSNIFAGSTVNIYDSCAWIAGFLVSFLKSCLIVTIKPISKTELT